MTMGLVEPNDAGAEYQAYRQQASAEDVIARARAKLAAPDGVTPTKPAVDTEKAANPLKLQLGGYVSTGVIVKGAKDVGRGVVEAPRQALGGVSDAVHNTFTGLADLGDWIDSKIGGRIDVPLTGIEGLDKFIAEPLSSLAGDKNEIAPAESTTGGLVRETARFLTGFVPLLRAGRAVGVGEKTAGVVAGAADAATRDPQEQNLVDLIKKYPALQNPVSDFLQSNPDDPEALARFKKGLEGVGLGALAEGLVLGVKALARAKNNRTTLQQAADTMAEQRGQYGELADRDFLALGDPKSPRVVRRPAGEPPADLAPEKLGRADVATATGVPEDVAAKGLTRAGEAGGQDVYINFARINSPQDVKKTLGQMADAFKADIDEARRGIQSNEETVRLADELGMSVNDLLNRRKGMGFNAEQAVAARKLWNASAEKLTELAKKAAAPNAGTVDQFNFRRMMALHYAIQAEVIGARTETARALQSWAIPVGGGVEKARAVQTMLDQMGGPQFSKAMAQRLSMLAGENPKAVPQFVQKSWAAATMDGLQEAWVNALLSNPKTHMVNTMSNAAVALQQIAERGLAGKFGGEVAPQEAVAMAYGIIESWKDAFRIAAKAFREGQTGLPGKLELSTHEPAIHGDWLRETGHNGMAAAVDFLGKGARVPTRALGAEDAFFKTVGYRMELHAQALRTAYAEGLRGPDMYRRMAEIVASPPEFIRLRATDAALYNTFTNEVGRIGQGMMAFRDKVPGAFFVMPFIKTPVNIARYSFERSPLAPLVGQWRADIAAGGARAELALARMGMGSAIMLTAADLADRGLVTGQGPDDPGEKENWLRQGKKPFSLKIGDRWVSYDRFDPIGMTMGFAASMTELVHRFDIEPEEMDEVNEVVAAGVAAVANTVINKTYMRGLSQAFEAVTESRVNPESVQNWMRSFTGSFVPSVVGAAEQIMDPVQREQMKIFDAALGKIPLLAQTLTPKRDLWGKPIQPDSGFGSAYDALSPIGISRQTDSPIDKEMERLDTNIQRINKKLNWDGVEVNLRDWPQVYDEYTRLAGNGLKHPAWGLGAKDLLDAIVSGKHDLSEIYRLLPDTRRPSDGGKAGFLSKMISEYRSLARREIVDDPRFADFAEKIAQGKADKREKRNPEFGNIRLP